MNTKNLEKKEIYKLEIIQKSREILARLGYKKTTTEEISKQLDRTKAALYHYFTNREEIIKAVVKYEGNSILVSIKDELEKLNDPVDSLRSFFKIRAEKIHEFGNYYRFVRDDYFNYYTFLINTLEDYHKEEFSILTTIIKDGVDKKIFQTPNIPLSAKALLKSIKAYDFYIFQGEEFKNMENELHETLKIFIRGISTK